MRKDELRSAREILIKYGFLLRFNDLEVYHGRVGTKGDKDWSIDPEFNNASNNTGNRNVNKISALSAGSIDVAQEFADVRLRSQKASFRVRGEDPSMLQPEVYRIVSSDQEAVVFNNNFNFSSLSLEQKEEIKKAIRTMNNFGVSELVPYLFEERNLNKVIMDAVTGYMAENHSVLLTKNDIDVVYDNLIKQNLNISKESVNMIIKAMNTKNMLKTPKNVKYLLSVFVGNGHLEQEDPDSFPISEEFLSAWLSNNHVIGLFRKVDSATLDKTIDAFSLFDLDKINTQKAVGEKYQLMLNTFQEISDLIDSFEINSKMCKFMKKATPEETLAKIRTVKYYDNLFKAKAGVWEGFTIGEHTETTLRVFEDTYDGRIPENLIPFIKLTLIAHDIGKGMIENNIGLNQKDRNEKYAKEFCVGLGLPEQIQKMLLFVIGDSQSYTSEYYIRRNLRAINNLKQETKCLLTKITDRVPTEKEVDGLVEICKILQTCDSAAYTRYAVTRREGTNEYYYNGSDNFTRSFKHPTGMKKRSVQLIEPSEE